MRRATWRSEKARKSTLPRNDRPIHATLNSGRIAIVDDSSLAHANRPSGGRRVFARMAASSDGFRKRNSRLARPQFFPRSLFDLGGSRLAARCIRRGNADGSYGSASAADDDRSPPDVGRGTDDAAAAWLAEAICPVHSRSVASPAGGAVDWEHPFRTCARLACGCRGAPRMARAFGVYTRLALGRVARRRAVDLPCGRVSFLVAGCSALA